SVFFFVLPFFFSSRRRHTRFSRDWSSDVCSSDLEQVAFVHLSRARVGLPAQALDDVLELPVNDNGLAGGAVLAGFGDFPGRFVRVLERRPTLPQKGFGKVGVAFVVKQQGRVG